MKDQTHVTASTKSNDVCEGCGKTIEDCYYGGDCLEMRAIYRKEQKEKLQDIDLEEIICSVCGYSYGECSHKNCW